MIEIDQHAGALGTREPHDAGNVELRTVAKADVRDGDELRALIDRLFEHFQRNIAVGGARHVHDTGTARLLRVPDLGIGRELEIAHHNLVARAREVERARQRIEARGDGGGHRDLVG